MVEFQLVAATEPILEQFNSFAEADYKQYQTIKKEDFLKVMTEIGNFNGWLGVEAVHLVEVGVYGNET